MGHLTVVITLSFEVTFNPNVFLILWMSAAHLVIHRNRLRLSNVCGRYIQRMPCTNIILLSCFPFLLSQVLFICGKNRCQLLSRVCVFLPDTIVAHYICWRSKWTQRNKLLIQYVLLCSPSCQFTRVLQLPLC